jgi:hypothetical protein
MKNDRKHETELRVEALQWLLHQQEWERRLDALRSGDEQATVKKRAAA